MAKYIVVSGIRIATEFEQETFGRLTTIGPKFRLGRHTYQVCQCECGSVKVVATGQMQAGNTSSCGCLKKIKCALTTHGKTGTPEHKAWKALNARCHKVNDIGHKNYGGRGIKVCDRWMEPNGQGFLNFLEDMGPKPSPEYTVERNDPDGNYCPENCCWATRKQQARNKRNTKKYTAFGKTMTLGEWAEETGLNYYALKERFRKMPPEQAMSIPIGEIPRDAVMYEFNGKSQSLPDWCKELGIVEETARGRLRRGDPIEKVLSNASFTNPRTIYLEVNGEKLTLKQWSERTGLSVPSLYGRIKQGYSPEDVISKPPRKRRSE